MIQDHEQQAAIEARAIEFAQQAHGEQKYGTLPYMVHLAAVRAVLGDFGIGGNVAVAAWLHDVLEDTSATHEQLALRFGEVVRQLVWAVTGVGKNRKERNADAYAKIRANPESLALKLADRIANCEASARGNPGLLGMYRQEFGGFKEQLEPLRPWVGCDLTGMWDRLKLVLR
jgi:guanosine-3',5'-bis(diphosphate) 3'-pyrophosphohydrolase